MTTCSFSRSTGRRGFDLVGVVGAAAGVAGSEEGVVVGGAAAGVIASFAVSSKSFNKLTSYSLIHLLEE
jgi:hypothetical protein